VGSKIGKLVIFWHKYAAATEMIFKILQTYQATRGFFKKHVTIGAFFDESDNIMDPMQAIAACKVVPVFFTFWRELFTFTDKGPSRMRFSSVYCG
jgi:hypothetical protein